jgi:hypothetical protein
LLFITGKAKNMQSELSPEIVATVDRTEKVAGETAEVAGGDSDGSKSGKRSYLRDLLDKLLGEEQSAVLVESAKIETLAVFLLSISLNAADIEDSKKLCKQSNIDIVAWHGGGGNDARKGKRECRDNDSYIVLQPKDNKRVTARVM